MIERGIWTRHQEVERAEAIIPGELVLPLKREMKEDREELSIEESKAQEEDGNAMD